MRQTMLYLLFLLAFVSVFAVGLAHATYRMTDGTCVAVFGQITAGNGTPVARASRLLAPELTMVEQPLLRRGDSVASAMNNWSMVGTINYYKWTGTMWQIVGNGGWSNNYVTPENAAALAALLDYPDSAAPPDFYAPPAIPMCQPKELECPDSDSDGVCDACDPAPDNSTAGGKKYLKGWYEINGQTVGYLTSHSPENASFDEISWTNAAVGAPGVSAVLGMGGADGFLFDSDEFIAAGGKYVYMQRPELISEMKCAPVQSLDQCSGACDEQIANQTAQEKVEDVPKENGMELTTDQKMDQHAALDPPDKCSDFYSRCQKACGGTAAVESQGCTSDSETGDVKAAICTCYHNGELQYADRWEDLASVQKEPVDNNPKADDVASGGTVSGTVDMGGPGTGAGDDGPSGGPVDRDGDGYDDGYQIGDRTVNYGPLMQGAGQLAGKFPFSLAKTAQEMARQFDAVGQCPQWTLPVFGHQLVVDLCIFDPVATIVRTLTAMVLGVVAYFGAMRLFM